MEKVVLIKAIFIDIDGTLRDSNRNLSSNTIDSKSICIKGIGYMGQKSKLETIPEVFDIIQKESNISQY